MDPRKEAICNALAAWIKQRPGLEFANYGTWRDKRSVSAYRADARSIARDKREAETLLRAVKAQEGITADMLLQSSRDAFSGRLTIEKMCYCGNCHKYVRDSKTECPNCKGELHATGTPCYGVSYCVGQYMPTEYRRAACAVLASALWTWQRENMPPPLAGEGDRMYSGFEPGHKSPTAMPAGTWLRNKFREEFGRGIAGRWFQ